MPAKIAIIEDNAAFRKIIDIRLKAEGYDTVVAEDGLTGLEMVRNEKPDLLITDLMLPGIDGHKISRMLKFDQRYRHIPIIMLTSRDLEEDADIAKQCGADAFIVKTTKARIVLDVIEKLLHKVTDFRETA
ncbi:response regulator [bacterium]|nr:response regulator [bacterium]